MLDLNELTNEGKYTFDDPGYLEKWAKTVSVGIFKLQLASSGKKLKRCNVEYRVKFPVNRAAEGIEKAKEIVYQLNHGTYNGPKTIKL